MTESHAVAVLGGGSFGTVVANIMATNGNRVRLWMRNAERCETIRVDRQNPVYLPDYQLHDNLDATTSLRPVVEVFDDMMHTEQAVDVEFVTR